MSELRKGLAAMLAACGIWGLSSIYYKQLSHIPPIEILAHRTLWSLLFFAAVLAVQGRLTRLRDVLSLRRALAITALAALAISANWFIFILSIQIGRATEASMGYYLFPLVAVAIGVVFFGERLSRLQGVAVALAFIAVLVQAFGLGIAPWIALILSFTFGFYGLVKKRLSAGPVTSVTAEVLLLSPVAVIVLIMQHQTGGAFGGNMHDSVMLAFSGVLTGLPLILFSYAAQRAPMGTIGLLQYLNPTLQFLCAVLVLGEPFTPLHAVVFALIWAAVAVYSLSALSRERATRRAAVSAGTSGMV